MQSGTYYQQKFAKKAQKYGENIILVHRDATATPCPGAFNPYTNEYDAARDRKYHLNNPSAPLCINGYITVPATEEEVKAFVGFSLTEEQIRLLALDEFRQGDLVIFFPHDVELDDVESIKYPITSDDQYGIYRKDSWYWDNTIIYKYTLCRLITTSG